MANQTHKIQLDTINPTDEKFVQYLIDHTIGIRWIELKGPAGGAPIIEYYASFGRLAHMVVEFWSDEGLVEDIEDISFDLV